MFVVVGLCIWSLFLSGYRIFVDETPRLLFSAHCSAATNWGGYYLRVAFILFGSQWMQQRLNKVHARQY